MKTIDYQQAKDIQARDRAPLVNVLSPDDFSKNYIPGSINIPHEKADFAEQVKTAIGGKDKPVVLYCAGYSCDASKKAALKLDQAGFTNVMCYEGGAKEWQEKTASTASAA